MIFYPTIITAKLPESKEFYVKNFGFKVVFENDWYIHLISESGIRLAFLQPDHPAQPQFFQKAYNGQGVIYNFEVKGVEAEYKRLQNNNVTILSGINSEEWGQKHFVVEDPNGLKIDVFQEIEPTDEYRV